MILSKKCGLLFNTKKWIDYCVAFSHIFDKISILAKNDENFVPPKSLADIVLSNKVHYKYCFKKIEVLYNFQTENFG